MAGERMCCRRSLAERALRATAEEDDHEERNTPQRGTSLGTKGHRFHLFPECPL